MYFNPKKEGEIEPRAAAEINTSTEQETSASQEDPVFRAKELLSLQDAGAGINFDLTKVLAFECVDEILEHWLPDGEQRGVQYVAYNPTRDDGGLGSFQLNTESGVWSDFATDDKGGDLISLIAYVEGISQSAAAVKILELITGLRPDACAAIGKRVAKAKLIPVVTHTPIMPVPANAKARPTFFGSKLGNPSSTWEYRNETGQLMFCMHRFNTPTGKSFLPHTYCADSSGHCDWRLLAPPAPRPAYGLDRLAARPDAPVLFTEGEKAADAAQRLFPGFVAVTTMNGAKSPEKTNFIPFAGREIYIAPDNDEAGIGYKDALLRLLTNAGAQVKAVMRLDLLAKSGEPLANGYDLADAEAEGWTAEHVAAIGEGLWGPVAAKNPLLTKTEMTETGKGQSHSAEKLTKKKSVVELAADFAQQTFGGNLAYFDNQILAYNQGYWSPLNPDVQIKKPILDMLGDGGSISKVKSIFELVQLNAAVFPEAFERRSALICLNNGTINPMTGELLAHAVDHRLTNRVAINYDVAAQCPLWLRTLDEIFAPDADKAEKIQLLQEYIGYCLIPDTRHHKFVWMVGGGGNGKSLIISIITALLGKKNISYAQIEQLGEKFVRAELQGKLVNISSEMSSSATVTDSYLKQITSGEMITAERKNERPFSFRSYARLIGATNMLPRLLDHSQGFFRRAIILRFNRQFLEAEQDINREANLMAELSGILNWSIVGLQSLLHRGSFVEPASSKAEAKQYQVHSDPVRQFAEDQLQRTECKANMVKAGYLYSEFVEWSADNGYSSMAINKFTERLSDIGFKKMRDKDGRYWNAKYFQYEPNSLTNINGDSSIPVA